MTAQLTVCERAQSPADALVVLRALGIDGRVA